MAQQSPPSGPVTPVGLNHLVLNVRDIEESHRFWTEILGFKQVGELKVTAQRPNPPRMRFYSGDHGGQMQHPVHALHRRHERVGLTNIAAVDRGAALRRRQVHLVALLDPERGVEPFLIDHRRGAPHRVSTVGTIVLMILSRYGVVRWRARQTLKEGRGSKDVGLMRGGNETSDRL